MLPEQAYSECDQCAGLGQVHLVESNENYIDCPRCQELLTKDLAMLVRRFIHITRQGGPLGNSVPILWLRSQAFDFLQRKGLAGNILREGE